MLMTEDKKNGCCCGGGKKLIFGILLGALIFFAGMLFAKYNCGVGQKMCIFPSAATRP